MTSGLTLDAGALIAWERGEERIRALLRGALAKGWELDSVPEVVAQVWRGGPRQARLAALLSSDEVSIPPYDAMAARAVGAVAGRTGISDVIDVHMVVHAVAQDHAVVTTDPDDLGRVLPSVTLIAL